MKLVQNLLVLIVSVSVCCCTPEKKQPTPEEIATHKAEVEKWYEERVNDLKARNGWLNLVGLFWLEEGTQSFGSDSSNNLVFPSGKIEAKGGELLVKGQVVSLVPAKGIAISVNGQPITTETVIFHPDSARAINLHQGSTVTYGSLEWYIIRRDDKLGVRLRDLESDGIKNFRGIERYPVDINWKVAATFEPNTTGQTINITNVLGQTTAEELAGVFTFEWDGVQRKLYTTGSGKKVFAVFGDLTNGKETYGAGRFIYIPRPDSGNVAFIDFNEAYNPPCVFTEFATCPLPPKENKLDIEVTAGEKDYHTH